MKNFYLSSRVEDNVEKHLNMEVESLKKSQVLLKQNALELEEEIRQMKKNRYNIEKDLVDKEAAMDIDQETAQLKVSGPMKKSRETRYPAAKQKQSFTPSSWQENTEKNLELANHQIKSCLGLQAQSDTVLGKKCAFKK